MIEKIKKIISETYIAKRINTYKKLNKIRQKQEKKSLKKKTNKRHNYQIQLKIKNRNYDLKKIFSITFLILILAIIFIYNSSFFKIKKIEVLRQDPRTNISIAYMAIWDLKWKHIFKVDKNKLKEKLKNYQNNINYINITKFYPSTLRIKIWSYKEIYNTTINWKNYTILENGSVIPTNKPEENLLQLNILTNKQEKFVDYKQILKKKYLDKIKYIEKKLNKNLLTLQIKEIDYYVTAREAHFIFKNNLRIIFDISWNIEDIDKQIKKLIIFNKEYKNLNKTDIIYIDLRVRYKLYYCNTEEEYKCYQNLKRIYEIKK